MKQNTIILHPRYHNPKAFNSIPLLSAAAVALGAAILMTLPSKAADKKTALNPADERFIQIEAAEGTTLVRIAGMAEKQSERDDIKAFAGTLVTDHTKVSADLEKLALEKGVELTTKITPKNAKLIKSFDELSGAEFDKQFLSTVQSAHQKCVDHLKGASADAKDEDLKAWATATLPGVEEHLAKAKELGGESSQSAARGTGNPARKGRDGDAKTVTPSDPGNE